MRVLLILSRLLVGLLFVFSGFVKAVDPLGFTYKLQEYFVVFGTDFLSPIALYLSMLICAVEIFLGLAVLVGSQLRYLSWLLLAMILFFVWLTGYSAVTGAVKDCGCFGAAIPMNPVQSFIKDLVLLGLIVIIFIYRHEIRPFFSVNTSRAISWCGGILSLLLTIYCYIYLPILDFRPYKVGNNIPKLMQDTIHPVTETKLIYKNKKTGETKELTTQTLDQKTSQDTFVRQKTITIKEGKLIPTIHGFHITSPEGEDMTQKILNSPQPVLLIVAYDLEESAKPAFGEINRLYKQCRDEIKFRVLTSSPYQDVVDPFRHEVQASYPFYTVDATTLKTIIRSNPGLVLLNKGIVKGKWDYHRIPTCQTLIQKAEK